MSPKLDHARFSPIEVYLYSTFRRMGQGYLAMVYQGLHGFNAVYMDMYMSRARRDFHLQVIRMLGISYCDGGRLLDGIRAFCAMSVDFQGKWVEWLLVHVLA
jgi:hypothetical protein